MVCCIPQTISYCLVLRGSPGFEGSLLLTWLSSRLSRNGWWQRSLPFPSSVPVCPVQKCCACFALYLSFQGFSGGFLLPQQPLHRIVLSSTILCRATQREAPRKARSLSWSVADSSFWPFNFCIFLWEGTKGVVWHTHTHTAGVVNKQRFVYLCSLGINGPVTVDRLDQHPVFVLLWSGENALEVPALDTELGKTPFLFP